RSRDQSTLKVGRQPSLARRPRRRATAPDAVASPPRWTSSAVSTNNDEPGVDSYCSSVCKSVWHQTDRRANRKRLGITRICMIMPALAVFLAPLQAVAQDKLVVSAWGGSWRDMVDNLIGKKFTAATGVPVEYITGGTIDRLNKEKLAKGNPESDI